MSATAIDTLVGLLEHYSPSGREQGAVDFLVGCMTGLGFTRTYRDRAGNAVGLMGNGPRQLALLGHIDTVPGEIPVRREGDLLYGRGAVDAKGPLAAFVDAAGAVGPLEGWQIVVIGAVDEERDSIGARHIVDRFHPEAAIIGEPSRWDRITLGYKGSAWARITVQSVLTHPAGGAASPSELAVSVWNRIHAWADQHNKNHARIFDQVTPRLQGMASGDDGFAGWAELQIGCRLPPDYTPETWYAQLRELAAGAQIAPLGYPIPAYRADKNTSLVRAFLGSIRDAGGKPGFVLKTGTADMNIVAPIWNCPVAAYGPGDSALDHTADEHIDLTEYAAAVRVLSGVLKKLGEA